MKANHESVTRLVKTASGQLGGIQKMIDEDRYCIDIATQLLAAQAVLKKATKEILRAHMADCVTDAVAAQDASDKINELIDIFDQMTR